MKTHKLFGLHIPYKLAKNFGPQNCYESYKSFWRHQSHEPFMNSKDFGARISVSGHKSPGVIMTTHRPIWLHEPRIPYMLAKNFEACLSFKSSKWMESLQGSKNLFGFTGLTSLIWWARLLCSQICWYLIADPSNLRCVRTLEKTLPTLWWILAASDTSYYLILQLLFCWCCMAGIKIKERLIADNVFM